MKSWMLVLALLSPLSGGAYDRRNQHARPEPLTVLPLSLDQSDYRLAVNGALLDNAIGPVKPSLHVRVLEISPKRIRVELHNVSDTALRMQLFQVMADGRFSPGNNCPLQAGAKSIEVWNEAFDAIGFGPVKQLTAAEAKSAKCE
jgi:hypothetical protein